MNGTTRAPTGSAGQPATGSAASVVVRVVPGDRDGGPGTLWPRVVSTARDWIGHRRLREPDVVVLMPSLREAVALRAAWAGHGGWLPRIETPETLAASLGPPPPRPPGALTFDPVIDRLQARARLSAIPATRAWAQRDPRGWQLAARQLALTAAELAGAAAARPPHERPAWWDEANRRLAGSGVAARALESALVDLALDWARESLPLATDRSFDARPAAWIVSCATVPFPLAESVVRGAGVPVLRIEVEIGSGAHGGDDPLDAAFEAVAAAGHVGVSACGDLEHEARVAAAAVIEGLRSGPGPVALVAEDRLLVRRVHALLVRHGVAVHDESGWRLSTSRAAASLMAWLRVLQPGATVDDWVDALKPLRPASGIHRPDLRVADAGIDQAVEAWLRRQRRVRLDDPLAAGQSDDAGHERAASLVVRAEIDRLQALRGRWRAAAAPGVATLPLARWLELLGDLLRDTGLEAALRGDEAGRAVLAALRLADPAADAAVQSFEGQAAWARAAAQLMLDRAGFVDWVDEVLESETFVPAAEGPNEDPQRVVIASLAAVALRPFGTVVIPGADERTLGRHATPDQLIDDTNAEALGLPCDGRRRLQQARTLLLAASAPSVTISWRRQDEQDVLGPSVLLMRLEQAAYRVRGQAPARRPDGLQSVVVAPRPARRGRATLRLAMPERMSATAIEWLRACPYRFHAGSVLRLREAVELDEPPDKRAYGEWLHRVLKAFHEARRSAGAAAAAPSEADEVATLEALATAARADMALDADEFALFEAGFRRVARRYVQWLRGRDRDGWTWVAGELALRADLDAWAPQRLEGRLDRFDLGDAGRAVEVLDYKTSSLDDLKRRVRDPGEDSQLLFYATLLRQQAALPAAAALDVPVAWPPATLQAAYLALDAADGIETVSHVHIGSQIDGFIAAIGHDLARLRDGVPARALGEGKVCETCAVRGLCRRDHAVADGPDGVEDGNGMGSAGGVTGAGE